MEDKINLKKRGIFIMSYIIWFMGVKIYVYVFYVLSVEINMERLKYIFGVN